MSIVHTPGSPRTHRAMDPPGPFQWRLLCLGILFLLTCIINVCLLLTAPPPDPHITFLPVTPFMLFWLAAFLPYLAASILILSTMPAAGRRRWVELGLILGGAGVLRAMLLLLPPDLSHDSWRYLWDARVTLHGYSPYVYAPEDPILAPLRNFLLSNSRFRNVPTLYPPGAEATYVLSYLIAPDNLYVLKGIFVVFDLVTGAALALLLGRLGLDPSRCIIYAWCPLPIVEFAIQGHMDAVTIMFMVLALLCALSERRGMRVLTGFLIALATLSKIYPIVLLIVVLRRRDRALLVACFATILLVYIPYLILGHGQVLGFFTTYTADHSPNGGLVEQIVSWGSATLGMQAKTALVLKYLIDLALLIAASLLILWLRYRQLISQEGGVLIMVGMIFVVSSHIYPWYTPALLPWVAVLAVPIWSRSSGLSGKGLAVAMAWYFPYISIISYFFGYTLNWSIYYLLGYGVTLLGLAIACYAAWSKGNHRPLRRPPPDEITQNSCS